MTAKQRAMLLTVISQWVGIVNDSYAKTRMAEIDADLNETYFAWSGPTTHETGKNGSSFPASRGRDWSSSSRRRAWAVIRPCTSTPSIAIQPTTTA